MTQGSARDFWNDRYEERRRIWSGRPNVALVDVVDDMPPGRALDLGAGEGADSIWLACQGWEVTGVDVSSTALARAAEAIREVGSVDGSVEWVEADLATWEPNGDYDLISACFLQSRGDLDFDADAVLRRMAEHITPGGHLLVVGHATTPPWSEHREHGPCQRTAGDQVAALAMNSAQWQVVVSEHRSRPVTGPDGQEAAIEDSVVLFGRR